MSILVFPPVISPLRHLIHKFVDKFYYPRLCSFSVGQEDDRRVIVGSTSRITRCSLPYACIHEKLFSTSKVLEKLADCICSQRIKLLLMQDSEFATFMSTYENSRIVLENNDTDKKMSRMKEENKAPFRDRLKRPDKQLYVPRALRKTAVENKAVRDDASKTANRRFQKSETTVKSAQTTVNEKSVCGDSILEKQELDKVRMKDKTPCPSLNDISSSTCSSISSDKSNTDVRTVQAPAADSVNDAALNTVNTVQKFPANCIKETSVNTVEETDVNSVKDSVDSHNIAEKGDILKDTEMPSVTTETCDVSDVSVNGTVKKKVESEEGEVLSSDNHDKMKTGALKVSEIKLQNSECSSKLVHGDLKKSVQCVDVTPVQSSVARTNVSLENQEDSWETMFNDEGDCLDPKFIKELSDITGRIDLTVAKSDYSDYQPVSRNAPEEYNNIVELFGFPVEFSTQDLTSAFSMFQEASYNIKWVDDCHALAIFSSPVIASQALHLNHPFIKVRPVSEGIKESKEKARFCARMFEVHKPRPVTSAALARRLVSGALGLKVNASKEQRDMERNMLREAREKKKLKAKQRQDIWNGIVS